MYMEVPISKQNLADAMCRVESELEEMRETVQQGTEEADSDLVLPASEVFSELRRRNAAAVEAA